MHKIVPIVEGPGDADAIGILCGKILREKARYDVQIDNPFDAKGRSNITKKDGLERLVERAWNRPNCEAILILVDLDTGCSVNLARSFTNRVLAMGTPKCTVVTVVAKMEFEAWFLASLTAMVGKRIGKQFMLPADAIFAGDVEAKAGVKEWLTSQVLPVDGYRRTAYDETRDQAAMTRLIDPILARKRSRSFRRMCHAIEEIVDAIDNNKIVVTPEAD